MFGPLWVITSPLIVLLVHWFIFRNFMPINEIEYLSYLMGVLLPWLFLKTSLDVSVSSFPFQVHPLKNTPVSPLMICFSTVTEYFIHYLLLATLLLGISYFSKMSFYRLHFFIKSLPATVNLYVAACVLSVIFSSLQTKYKDTKYILDVAMRFLFLLCPILYLPGFIKSFNIFLSFNPIYYIFKPMMLIYSGKECGFFVYLASLSATLSLLLVSYVVIRRYQNYFYIS